ncbi:MAG: IPT/TIG domain-containing protein [Thermoanaerobaculia bacterium]|nr:IPT/TIG domain-containing protein [Thermoanaerobaculia bacterium]
MRQFVIAISLLTVLPALAGALHQATPIAELIPRVEFKRELPAVPAEFNASATKAFSVVARQWVFDVSPGPFVVNQGDSVTITLTSNDVDHGLFIENYMLNGVLVERGSPKTIAFVATTPGTFTYFCVEPTCGVGHSRMSGIFTVNAVQTDPPTITSFTPLSGSTAGGNAVVITGTGFANNATVRFGGASALGVTVNSTTQITVFAPAANAGTVSISVTNPDGQSVTSTTLYTYAPLVQQPGKKRRSTRR